MIHLENTSKEPQAIFTDDGHRYVIKGLGDRSFADPVASKFLAERGAFVRRFVATRVPPLLPGEKATWIANQTGSPFVPAEFSVQVMENDRPKEVKVPNLVAIPTLLSWKMPVGQGPDPYGRFAVEPGDKDFNLLPMSIFLRPGHRAEVSRAVSEFILRQDVQEGELKMGKTVVSRAPSAFEPTEEWPVADIAFYGTLVDPKGFSETVLNGIIREICDGEVPTPAQLLGHPELDAEIRHAIFTRLCYRLHDPNFSLPTKAAFEKFYSDAKAKHAGKRSPVGTTATA
jgi:hypothetical protein